MDILQGRTYPTFEAARKDIDDLATRLGYTFVIHRSTPNAKDPRTVVLRCGRGRSASAHPYSNAATPPEKRRKARSKMTNCPCRISVKLNRPLGNIPQPRYWYIAGAQDGGGGGGADCNMAHNHEPADGRGAFSRLRREAVESRRCYVMALTAAGVSPTAIVAVLRQDVDEAVRTVTAHDVSNLVRKVKLEEEHKTAMTARGLNFDGTPLAAPQIPEAAPDAGMARSLGRSENQRGGEPQRQDGDGSDEVEESEGEPSAAQDDAQRDRAPRQHQISTT